MIRFLPRGITSEEHSTMEKYHQQCKTADGDAPIYLGTLINCLKIVTFVMVMTLPILYQYVYRLNKGDCNIVLSSILLYRVLRESFSFV